MIALVNTLREEVFFRYLASSVAALAVDVGILAILVSLGAEPGPASAAAYSVGIVAHWIMVSRAVFGDTVAPRGPARTRQKALFVLSALAGLVVTTAIVSGGAMLGLRVAVAKASAVGCSFVVNWLLRRWLVFKAPAASARPNRARTEAPSLP